MFWQNVVINFQLYRIDHWAWSYFAVGLLFLFNKALIKLIKSPE